MKPRPLPKTVAPLPDELLSGWLSRLAAANYCDDAELLAHIEIGTAHGPALDFNIDAAAAKKIASAAQVDPDGVRSLTFPTMTPREAGCGGVRQDVRHEDHRDMSAAIGLRRIAL